MKPSQKEADAQRETRKSEEGTGEPHSPPILGSWARLYSFVLGELAFLIILFFLFSRYFQ